MSAQSITYMTSEFSNTSSNTAIIFQLQSNFANIRMQNFEVQLSNHLIVHTSFCLFAKRTHISLCCFKRKQKLVSEELANHHFINWKYSLTNLEEYSRRCVLCLTTFTCHPKYDERIRSLHHIYSCHALSPFAFLVNSILSCIHLQSYIC
jgi:hypothetical protein